MPFNLVKSLREESQPVSASEFANRHGVSYPTLWRATKMCGDSCVQWREGRASYLAATRSPGRIPVRAIGTDGSVQNLDSIAPLHYGGTLWVNWRGQPKAFDGLPPEIEHARPQGFLGRAAARQYAAHQSVSDNPDEWSTDTVLRFLVEHGDNLPGNLIFGDAAFERWLDQRATPVAIPESALLEHLPEWADKAMAGDAPGSSAAGEQPKFAMTAARADGSVRHLLVKFSPSDTSQASARWSDLLACEHIAADILGKAGLATARSQVIDAGGRRFLASERFDRIGPTGRRASISLAAIDDEYFGRRATPWSAASYRLEQAGMLAAQDAANLRLVYAFGLLIANSDMHYGNASLLPARPGQPMQLAPIYDMLPMRYAPQRSEIRLVDFVPPAAIPGIDRETLDSARDLAAMFWTRCASDPLVSTDFRDIAQHNAVSIGAAGIGDIAQPTPGM